MFTHELIVCACIIVAKDWKRHRYVELLEEFDAKSGVPGASASPVITTGSCLTLITLYNPNSVSHLLRVRFSLTTLPTQVQRRSSGLLRPRAACWR